MKVKLDDYEVRVLINGLVQQHRSYDAKPTVSRVICQCLMEWQNREIQAERHGAVDALNELLIRFTR